MSYQHKQIPRNPRIKRLRKHLESIMKNTRNIIGPIIKEIEKIQASCKPHDFKKIVGFDKNYSPNADGTYRGQNVLKGRICAECGFYALLKGKPWENCFKCGEKMNLDHRGKFGKRKTFIYKCQDCGHEYEKV